MRVDFNGQLSDVVCMSDRDLFASLIEGIESRAAKARRRAFWLPRKERKKFIYDQTFRNDIEAVAYPLAKGMKCLPNFVDPKTYHEKMRSLYLTHPNPLMSLAADKIEMHKLCSYFDTPIVPLGMYGAYEDPADLDVTTLPETCYLKVNDGCKMNMLHARGKPMTPLWLRIFERKWWHVDHWRRQGELHYRDIPRRMLVEEALLPLNTLRETAVYCIYGEPYVYSIVGFNYHGYERFRGQVSINGAYQRVAARFGKYLPISIAGTSDEFEAILETAKRLSRPFAHSRIDFMQNGDRTVVGEITLSPRAFNNPDRDLATEIERGDLIDMDRLEDSLATCRQIAADLGWPVEASFGHLAEDPRLATGGQ
ncbi:ATP-grasp fold amidoligase family protein [uncultured Shimia sp.]|uniref:ATP-grasp fold amidoligase family protein n=1 Tax=uncultured Shimia sp. TaxID=573152 RepID=UPI0026210601|nr:ATP-grasp fold amidoligase family protein [uncultured Shimia sp.]